MASIINATTTAGVTVTGDNSGSLQLATNNGTTAVTIDTSQNVGIGTSSPSKLLDVAGNAAITGTGYLSLQRPIIPVANQGTPQLAFQFYTTGTTYTTGAQIQAAAAGTWTSTSAATNLLFYTTPAASTSVVEAMRIASDGTISTTIGSTLFGAYPARAWVNFNGTGTPAIRANRNVSSITDNGTGDYTINFTQAMPDIEYSVAGAVNEGSTDNALPARIAQLRRSTPTTSSFRIGISNLSNTAFDAEYVFFQVFR